MATKQEPTSQSCQQWSRAGGDTQCNEPVGMQDVYPPANASFTSHGAHKLCKGKTYHRSHQRRSMTWHSHIRQLIKISSNEQMVRTSLADALQQVQAASGQPQALTAGASFRRNCIVKQLHDHH